MPGQQPWISFNNQTHAAKKCTGKDVDVEGVTLVKCAMERQLKKGFL
jgi:hypothetical protein